jgi:hypothetical protein
MSDLRPDLGVALAVFGLPATVTVPGGEPVAATAIWLSPVSVETVGVLAPTDRPQAVLALPRSAVPSVPRGTVIEAAETEGGAVRTWIVEALLHLGVDELRVLVIPTESA